MNPTPSIPTRRNNDIVIQELKDETLVYDLIANKAFCLNKTAANVWNACNGFRTAEDIRIYLSRKLGTDISLNIVLLALSQLRAENLILNYDEIDSEGFSRRQLVKHASFGALVTLPIISSLVAPRAINAQSQVCSTAAPGGIQCRCDCSVSLGGKCGTGLPVDSCNAGCTCTRTASSCYGGSNPTLINTAQGSCG